MSLEIPKNEITPNKTDKEFEYWFKEYDDKLRSFNVFWLAKNYEAKTKEYWISFTRTKPKRNFLQTGTTWEECFQKMVDEASTWDIDDSKTLKVNSSWTAKDIEDLSSRGSEAYPEIKYAVIQRKALNNPKDMTEEEVKYFLDNIKEDDFELAADIKKLWQS